MKNILLIILIACLLSVSLQKLVLNTTESTVHWKGKMWLGNDSHEGTIRFSSGNMTMAVAGKILSMSFEIDMNTFKTLDARPDKD